MFEWVQHCFNSYWNRLYLLERKCPRFENKPPVCKSHAQFTFHVLKRLFNTCGEKQASETFCLTFFIWVNIRESVLADLIVSKYQHCDVAFICRPNGEGWSTHCNSMHCESSAGLACTNNHEELVTCLSGVHVVVRCVKCCYCIHPVESAACLWNTDSLALRLRTLLITRSFCCVSVRSHTSDLWWLQCPESTTKLIVCSSP